MNVTLSAPLNPYLVLETESNGQIRSYEYSSYATRLGSSFVESICIEARDEFANSMTSGRNIAHCIALHIAHLHYLFGSLQVILDSKGLVSVEKMVVADWHKFTALLTASIDKDQSRSEGIKKAWKANAHAALKRYAKSGLIPKYFDPKVLPTDGPYYVLQTTPWKGGNAITYEYSKLAARVGEAFLASSCALIRELRQTANVKVKTWIDNYASCFDRFIQHLHTFLDEQNFPSASVLSECEWQSFLKYLEDSIFDGRISDRTGAPLSTKTKNKLRLCTNNLLGRMAVAGLLPKRFEIASPNGRKRSVNNFTPKTNPREKIQEVGHEPPSSPFTIFVKEHNRKAPYDYAEFQPLARALLLVSIPILKKRYCEVTEGTAKSFHHAFTSFLRFLYAQKIDGVRHEFFSMLETEDYRNISSLTWEKVIYDWRDHLIQEASPQKPVAIITKHKTLGEMRQVWTALASAGVVPEVKLKGIKGAKARHGKKGIPSLAQLKPTDETLADSITAKQASVNEKLIRYFDDDEKSEAVEFINALCAHISPERVEKLALEALVTEIAKLNAERIESIRRCAEKDFLYWYEHWQKGQQALVNARFSPAEIVDLLDRPERSVSERNRNATEFIHGNTEQHLGNALNLIIGAVGSDITGIGGRYHHIARRWGGIGRLHAYIHPHQRATLALWVLLLIDTGANCEVAREMPADCIRKTEDLAYMTVMFGLKARAGYKRIKDCLPVEPQPGQILSTVQAIHYYQEMSARYREMAHEETAKLLLLDIRKGVIIGLTEFRARDDFKAFLKNHAELMSLHIRPSFIRPSYLLKLQHETYQAPMEVAQAQADHSSTTTTLTYTGRAHTKLVYAMQIREFTQLYQAVVIASIDGAAEKLGISSIEAAKLFSDASRSGLGVACLNPNAGIQPGTRRGENCTRLDACPGCEMRYLVGTVDNIADLILFQEYLKSMEEVAMQTSPESWEKRWLPWLALAEVALAKFAHGETASAFAQARVKADARRPTYKPFPLF